MATETTILMALCVTCGYVTDDESTVELWNGYGDHGGNHDDGDNGDESLWVLSDGTVAHVIDNPDGDHQHTVLTGEEADAARTKVAAALTSRTPGSTENKD
jgi:hypothetical protein